MNDTLAQIRQQTAYSQQSAEAAKRAADAAISTLNQSKVAFVTEVRPYIISKVPVFVGNPFTGAQNVNIHYLNVGKTPAARYRIQREFFRYQAEPKAPNGSDAVAIKRFIEFLNSRFNQLAKKDDMQTSGPFSSFTRQDLAPGAEQFVSVTDRRSLNGEERVHLDSGMLALFAIGIIRYTDAFNIPYETEFCWYFFGNESEITTWHSCDSHNLIK